MEERVCFGCGATATDRYFCSCGCPASYSGTENEYKKLIKVKP